LTDPAPPYRQAFRVHSFDADERRRLAPRSLCAFLQEAAGRDADRRGAGMGHLLDRGLAWMLQRLVVEVLAWPAEQEEITVATWPTRFGGAAAERAFTVEDGRGRRRAQATSRWAVVDLQARRAVRLPDFIRAIPVGEDQLDVATGPVPQAPKEAPLLAERPLEVRRADLDVVGHANNTRYVEWGLEAVPDAWHEAHELATFDVAFRREAARGDVLRSRTYLAAEDALVHTLHLAPDGEALAAMATRWRRR
jgi:acyl-ACP thioesterase